MNRQRNGAIRGNHEPLINYLLMRGVQKRIDPLRLKLFAGRNYYESREYFRLMLG